MEEENDALRQVVDVPGVTDSAPSTTFLLAQAARHSVVWSNFYHRATLVAAIQGVQGVREAADLEGGQGDGDGGTPNPGGKGQRTRSKRRMDRKRVHSRNTASRLRRESMQIRQVLSQHASVLSGGGGSSAGESDTLLPTSSTGGGTGGRASLT